MITVCCEGHDFYYPICDVLRLFCGTVPKQQENLVVAEFVGGVPDKDISGSVFGSKVRGAISGPDGNPSVCSLSGGDPFRELRIVSRVTETSVETFVEDIACEELRIAVMREDLSLPLNREVKRQLYFLLSRVTGKAFPWGSLTGIRPTQVARELFREEEMTSIYGVREDKAHLAFVTRDGEDAVLKDSDPESLHVYIGIPFCPTRCSYCSFISQEAPRKRELLPLYVDAVLREMDLVLPGIGRPIETLYIGGGTPTVLDEVLFERFIKGVFAHPQLSHLKEVCVEAGRPDTITERKLQVLRDHGVSRICINPQTLCDATLLRVGRQHSAEDFEQAFSLARGMGFDVVNTDLIAGLPGESSAEFCASLSRIVEMGPENITVHSLYKKRRADLSREDVVRMEQEDLLRMEEMLGFAFSTLTAAGYAPYYMYKQKDTIGGHENVGYQRGGTACLYNVAMMSDLRSVLSFGAGGMSKRVFLGDDRKDEQRDEQRFEQKAEGTVLLPKNPVNARVERCSCIKDPIQYIQNVETMAEKKRAFFA